MKSLLTLMIVVLTHLIPTIAYANHPDLTASPAERADALTAKMMEELSIADDKRDSLYGVNLKYAEKVTAILESSSFKFSKIAQLKAMSDDKDKELAEILTPQQMDDYETMKVGLKKVARQQVESALLANETK